MVNEIPTSLFIVMVIAQMAFMLLAFIFNQQENNFGVFAGMLSVVFGFVNANMILNGNVVYITDTGTTVVVRSLPVHYLLQGMAIFMSIATLYLILMMVQRYIAKDKTLNKPFGKWQYE